MIIFYIRINIESIIIKTFNVNDSILISKQFWVEPGRFYDFNYLPLEPGSSIIFNKVLLSNQNGEINIGSPCLEQVKIKYDYLVKVIIHSILFLLIILNLFYFS